LLQPLTSLLPSRHYVSFRQAIMYRGAGFDIVWSDFAFVAGSGLGCFLASLALFRHARAMST
jgi:ABC-2 type transport system permease protein